MTAFKVLPFFGLYQVSLGAQLKSNIVGGENADQNHWPWMVAIFVKEQNPHNAADTKANFACGGTLIDPKWVLTAAHCVQCLDAKQIRVHVGIYERDDPRNEREVEFFIQHEANAHGIQRNDIALLKLSQPVKDVQLVTLSKASDVFSSNVECRVAGWGNIKQNVPLSKPGKLQELAVPLVNTQTCKESYKDSLTVFDESILCAGLGKTQNQKLSGTCQVRAQVHITYAYCIFLMILTTPTAKDGNWSPQCHLNGESQLNQSNSCFLKCLICVQTLIGKQS
uniref:Peptidase S1 domain-containing protein n=2 Tax=Paramormyrops kingsleyae TaxID=1676925 RepID=A0A3B3RNL6_9TELE